MDRNSIIKEFYKLLHDRGESAISLAEKIFTSRTYITRVIRGEQRRGNTWPRLRVILKPKEIALLEQVKLEVIDSKQMVLSIYAEVADLAEQGIPIIDPQKTCKTNKTAQ